MENEMMAMMKHMQAEAAEDEQQVEMQIQEINKMETADHEDIPPYMLEMMSKNPAKREMIEVPIEIKSAASKFAESFKECDEL